MRAVIILIILGFLVGCGNIAIKKDQIDNIKKIEVSRNVTYGKKAYDLNPGMVIGIVFGGTLGALYNRADPNEERDVMTYIIQEHSKLDEIAYEAFKAALLKDPTWASKVQNNTSPPDATIFLHIYYYGFDSANFLADGAEPFFGLIATMVDKNGNEIWKRGRGISDYIEGLPRYTVKEYLTDITRYDEACEHLATKLIDTYFINTLNVE